MTPAFPTLPPSIAVGCRKNKLPPAPRDTRLPSNRCDNTTSGLACRANCTVGIGIYRSFCTDGAFSQWYGECVRQGAYHIAHSCCATAHGRRAAVHVQHACIRLASDGRNHPVQPRCACCRSVLPATPCTHPTAPPPTSYHPSSTHRLQQHRVAGAARQGAAGTRPVRQHDPRRPVRPGLRRRLPRAPAQRVQGRLLGRLVGPLRQDAGLMVGSRPHPCVRGRARRRLPARKRFLSAVHPSVACLCPLDEQRAAAQCTVLLHHHLPLNAGASITCARLRGSMPHA